MSYFFEDIDADIQCFPLIRGVSEENIFTSIFCPRPQILTETLPNNNKQNDIVPELPMHTQVPQFQKYQARKQQRKKVANKQKKDYKKNICGYITKKIVREFMDPQYKQKVLELCEKYDCQYSECVEYYDKKIERITGPTHLDMLLNAHKQQSKMKKCFRQFFIWFLRHRYLRYLIGQGKMERKDIYIDYKNKTLLYLGSIDEKVQYNITYTESQSKQTSSIYGN